MTTEPNSRHYAGFWVRGAAFTIDFILLNVASLIPQYLLARVLGLSPFNEQMVGEALSLILFYWYYCRYQVRTGTTIGKQLFSVYVLNDATGEYLTHKQSVIRLFGYLVSMVIFGCGFLMAMFHPQKKTLHDLMAGTVCVRRGSEWKLGLAVLVAVVAAGLFGFFYAVQTGAFN